MLFYDTLTLLRRSSAARLIVVYATMTGSVYALSLFGEVIARKSLGASALQVTILSMVMPVTSLTSIWWGNAMKSRDQRPLILVTGLLGALALASGMYMETFGYLLLIYLIFNLAFVSQLTAQNRALQQHIPPRETGGLFGFSHGIRMILGAAMAAGFGWWLETADKGWQQLFPVVAVIAFLSFTALASIPTSGQMTPAQLPHRNRLTGPWKEVFLLLKRRPDYFRFEAAFMIYGIGFMMTLPVVPIYLVDDLALGYEEIGIARGTVLQLVMIAGIPLFGKLFDRSTPHRMAAGSFAILSLFPPALIAASGFSGTARFAAVIIAHIIFGIAMSGVMILWNLASMRFTGEGEDAGVYQSVHVAATGLRGLFAPLLGYLVMELWGRNTALMVSSALWLIAAGAMIIARRMDMRRENPVSLRAID